MAGVESPRILNEAPSSPYEIDTVDDAADVEFHERGAASATFTLSGKVVDKKVSAWAIASATVTITPGIPATKTNSQGRYTAKVSPHLHD